MRKFKMAKIPMVSEEEGEKLKKLLDGIPYDSIKTIGNHLLEGVNDITVMTDLPRIIVTHSIINSETLLKGLELCTKLSKDKDIGKIDPDVILDEMRKQLDKLPLIRDEKVEDRIKQLATPLGYGWANLEVERILKLHEQHQKSYFSLVYSSIVWIWTLFEIAITDLWETTLNMAFEVLGKEALKRLAKSDISNTEDKIKGKYIRLDYLAEFDYNIREHVGSILKHHFDFSSLYGIKGAYKFAFPKSTTIARSMDNVALKWLSEGRNLVVHKAGYIDDKYKNTIDTKQNVGEKLIIDARHIEIYLATIIKVFRDILNSANQYLNLEVKSSES